MPSEEPTVGVLANTNDINELLSILPDSTCAPPALLVRRACLALRHDSA